MNLILYTILLAFFLMGGFGIFLTNGKKNEADKKKNWLKYTTYFFIVNILIGTIIFCEKAFPYLGVILILFGYFEIINLQMIKKQLEPLLFCSIIISYTVISYCFYLFSHATQDLLLFTLFVVCVFDAFCQISGQLFGKRKIFSKISPNKTYEGLIGGMIMSVGTACFIGKLTGIYLSESIILSLGICCFSFLGDLLASWVKRKYNVKDFSTFLPGHGGFLDRFDSLLSAGGFVYLFNSFSKWL